jgi:hypothetical protein
MEHSLHVAVKHFVEKLAPRSRKKANVLRHGRDVHPAWVNVVTAALALKSFGGQVMRAEVMLESREGSGF